MPTLFIQADKDIIVKRIKKLLSPSFRQRGKMNVPQMIADSANAMEVASNEKKIKRTPRGYIMSGFFNFLLS